MPCETPETSTSEVLSPVTFPQLTEQLSQLLTTTKSTVSQMLEIFAETAAGSLPDQRGRVGKMRLTLRGKDSVDATFDRQARLLVTLLTLGELDAIVAQSCKHEEMKEFTFSDKTAIRKCADCGAFTNARKEILNPSDFNPFANLKKEGVDHENEI